MPEPWPELVRGAKWDAAWLALEALPDAEKSRAEIRYVRARVALARGDAARALDLLDRVEGALPLLADDVARRRAEAKLEAGPFADAGRWFAARASPAAWLDAAKAFEKAKDARRARAQADRVVASDERTHAQEAQARALRVRIANPPGRAERDDARWLATRGADTSAEADAIALVARLDPNHPLGARELLLRARVLSDAGRVDDALHAIDLAATAPDHGAASDLDRLRARGMALYHARGRWTEAATTLSQCADAGGPNAAEDAFHAARALSRADRDDDAIAAYQNVRRAFPKSRWADEAAFFVPYLRMLHGDWSACARGFDDYVRDRAAASELRDARRDGALCKLLDGQAKAARAAFERLAEGETDPLARGRMAVMAALAAMRDGDRAHAIARYTDTARSVPLSWPALVARARLSEAGAPLPPAIDAARPSGAYSPLAIAIPPPADLLHRVGLDDDAESALVDRETAVTSSAGERASEALCATYGAIDRARRRYRIAQSLPPALFASAPADRTRWAWDCAFPTPYAADVRAAETAEKLPRGLLWAVMRQESGFDPDAVSPAHAVGLMQLLPETARAAAADLALSPDDARLTSPSYAIRVAAHELRTLLDRFQGDVPLAVAAYNAGPESIARWRSRAPGCEIDTFVERIPFKETREYVARVMSNFARYAWLAGGGDDGVPRVALDLPR